MTLPAFPGGVEVVDFEFGQTDGNEGNPPAVVCMVSHNLDTGVTQRFWIDELSQMASAPFATDRSALVVAYSAVAEMACFIALGWPFPENIFDAYVEFRNITNGLPLPAGNGLLGALTYFGEPCMDAAQKDAMRDLVLRGAPWSSAEKLVILDYCEADVIALKRLYARLMEIA